jgi:hypothetical protein
MCYWRFQSPPSHRRSSSWQSSVIQCCPSKDSVNQTKRCSRTLFWVLRIDFYAPLHGL